METNVNRPADAEALDATQNNTTESVAGNEPAAQQTNDQRKRIKHEEHSVSRKYRLFSNHSSYGDSPHTSTSI